MKSFPWKIPGYLLLFLLACALMFGTLADVQESDLPALTQVVFQGQYRVEDGPWQPLDKGSIRILNQTVTLRGTFGAVPKSGDDPVPLTPGTRIALYLDHLGCTIRTEGSLPSAMETESPGMGKSGCAQRWEIYTWSGSPSPVEITLHNPHRYGNPAAVESFLRNLYLYSGDSFAYQQSGSTSFLRTVGVSIVITALILIGVAVFSMLLEMKESEIMWLVGMTVLFAGCSYILNTPTSPCGAGCISSIPPARCSAYSCIPCSCSGWCGCVCMISCKK